MKWAYGFQILIFHLLTNTRAQVHIFEVLFCLSLEHTHSCCRSTYSQLKWLCKSAAMMQVTHSSKMLSLLQSTICACLPLHVALLLCCAHSVATVQLHATPFTLWIFVSLPSLWLLLLLFVNLMYILCIYTYISFQSCQLFLCACIHIISLSYLCMCHCKVFCLQF